MQRRRSSQPSVSVPQPSRRGRKGLGQALIEYTLACAVLVGVFIIAAASLTNGENQYFTSLGPRLAPTPASFGTFAPTALATPMFTPLPTATPFALATPTPTPDTSQRNTTTTALACTPTSGVIPSAAAFQTTYTVAVTDQNGNRNATGTAFFTESPIGQGSFSSTSCTLSNSTCVFTYTTTVTGSRTLPGFYPGPSGKGNNGFQSSGNVPLVLSVTRLSSSSVSCIYQGTLVVGAGATCQITITDTSYGTKSTPTGTVTWTETPSSPGGTALLNPTTCTLGAGAAGSASCSVVFTPT